MRLTIRLLGTEIVHVCTDHACDPGTEGEELAGGTTASTLVGFSISSGDQRWNESPTPDLGE